MPTDSDFKAITKKRIKTAKKNGTRLGRKSLPESEKRKGWSRRLHPAVIEMITKLAEDRLMSDTDLLEGLIRDEHKKRFGA